MEDFKLLSIRDDECAGEVNSVEEAIARARVYICPECGRTEHYNISSEATSCAEPEHKCYCKWEGGCEMIEMELKPVQED